MAKSEEREGVATAKYQKRIRKKKIQGCAAAPWQYQLLVNITRLCQKCLQSRFQWLGEEHIGDWVCQFQGNNSEQTLVGSVSQV